MGVSLSVYAGKYSLGSLVFQYELEKGKSLRIKSMQNHVMKVLLCLTVEGDERIPPLDVGGQKRRFQFDFGMIMEEKDTA